MKVFRRGAGFVLGAAVWSVAAPAAHAQGITNPAKNPYPVTVKIDGQSYSDGRDTLPGYDDELCTPIPNVQYDFGEGQILYYNGEGELLATARWSEWSRISSYETWLAQQNPGTPSPTATATPAPTSQAPTSQAPTSQAPTSQAPTSPTPKSPPAKSPSTKRPAAKTPAAKNPATQSPSTKSRSASSPPSPSTTSSTPKQATPTPAAKRGTPTATKNSTATNDAVAAAPAVDGAPADAATTAAAPATTALAAGGATVDASAAPSPQTATNYEMASERTGIVGDAGDTRLAGVGILAGLFAVGCFCLLFGELTAVPQSPTDKRGRQ